MAAPLFDVDAVRAEFPLLTDRTIDDARLVYLDSGNTSQKPRRVIDAMSEFLENSYAPINRSSYRLAGEATEVYEGARNAVARLINAPSADEIVFTKNATEAMNLIAMAWGRANLGAATWSCSPRWSTMRTSCRGRCSPRSATSTSVGSG